MSIKKTIGFITLSLTIALAIWFLGIYYGRIFNSTNNTVEIGWPFIYKIESGSFATEDFHVRYNLRNFVADFLFWCAAGVFVTWMIFGKWFTNKNTK